MIGCINSMVLYGSCSRYQWVWPSKSTKEIIINFFLHIDFILSIVSCERKQVCFHAIL